jgi:hypothetical protein
LNAAKIPLSPEDRRRLADTRANLAQLESTIDANMDREEKRILVRQLPSRSGVWNFSFDTDKLTDEERLRPVAHVETSQTKYELTITCRRHSSELLIATFDSTWAEGQRIPWSFDAPVPIRRIQPPKLSRIGRRDFNLLVWKNTSEDDPRTIHEIFEFAAEASRPECDLSLINIITHFQHLRECWIRIKPEGICELLTGPSPARPPQLPQDKSVNSASEKIIYSWSGRGVVTTRPFKVSGRWELQWDADGEFFQVYLKSAEGEMLGVLANQAGKGPGSAFYPKGGEYYLQINAIGDWRIRVVNVP